MTLQQGVGEPEYISQKMRLPAMSHFFYFLASWCNAGHFFVSKVAPVTCPQSITGERQCTIVQQAG
jgi:hypothetical protein